MSMRGLASLGLKAAISVALLYFALNGVNWTEASARLAKASPVWLMLMVALLLAQAALAALRWREFARLGDIELPAFLAFRFTMIGTFFNQTLPSTVGGDAVRILMLARKGAGWRPATFSVLNDRVAGVTALAALVIVCLPKTLVLVTDPTGQIALLLIGFGSMAGLFVYLAIGKIRWEPLTRFWIFRQLAESAGIAFRLFASPRASIVVTILSILIHLLTVSAAWCAAKAIGAPVDFLHTLLLIPPVILIATVPISIAGWGVRESAMAIAFGYAGLAQADGLVISLLFGAGTFVIGLVGGLLWIIDANSLKEVTVPHGRKV